ncbi:hypothetical protein [uncultured Roseibium sp.]|uniref:hypothetical protein n=1 Tax=uncultured Roseibium sp. TaxID=1936171 RepID=UPI003216A325
MKLRSDTITMLLMFSCCSYTAEVIENENNNPKIKNIFYEYRVGELPTLEVKFECISVASFLTARWCDGWASYRGVRDVYVSLNTTPDITNAESQLKSIANDCFNSALTADVIASLISGVVDAGLPFLQLCLNGTEWGSSFYVDKWELDNYEKFRWVRI